MRLTELIDEHIDIPDGVYNLVFGAGEAGAQLVQSQGIDMVSMTGNVETGKQIMRDAADNLTQVSLELGGKAPALVWKNADIDAAVEDVLTARITNTGQVCTCAERVYVHSEVREEFEDKYVEAAQNVTIGDPTKDPDMGPHVNERELEKTRDLMSNMEELAGTGAWEYNTEEGELDFTEGTVEVYGVESDADLSLEEAFSYFHPDDRELLTDRFEECIETGEPYDVEVRLTTEEGTQKWVNAQAERVSTESGTCVRGYIQDITEQRKREDELKKYRRAFDEIPDPVVICDELGQYELVNDAFVELRGTPREQLKGKKSPYLERVQEEKPEEYEALMRGSQEVIRGEFSYDLGGANRDFECKAYRVTQVKDSEKIGVMTCEITERERRKKELEKYETVIEALTDAVYVLNEEGQFTYVNENFTELVGYEKEELLGNTMSVIKDEGALERSKEQLGRLLSSEGPGEVNFEVTVQPQDSDPVVCQNHMGVLPYEGDKFDGSVGVLRDITARKKREQELREIKGQYQALAENFPDGAVFLHDTSLQAVRAGGKELSEHGISSEEVLGDKPSDRYRPEIAQKATRHIKKALGGTSTVFEQEYKGNHYRVQTVPVRTEGEITHAMSVSQNITEEIERREKLKRQNERLEDFASVVSHDLRNPLEIARGRLELAQKDCDTPHIEDAVDAIERCGDLIDSLLTLARDGEEVSRKEEVELKRTVMESWQTVDTKEATLSAEIDLEVSADPDRLRQILENLFRNAVEHGGSDVTVAVGTLESDDARGFYIEDDGSGIPEKRRSDVFEAGHSSAEGGVGLGLRIVKDAVNGHDWNIKVKEGSDGGTRLEVVTS